MSSPALRFKSKDGQDFPNWEEAKIESLFTIKAGGDIDSSSVSAVKNDVNRYPIFSNSEKNLGLFGYADKFKIKNESITVTGRGSLGIAIPRYEPYYPIVRLLSLIPKSEFNVYFGAMSINRFDVFVESTGVPQLTAPQMSEYVISYPSIEEQTKIANFLTAVDEKVHLLTQKHDLLTQYKKCVMQQIFSQELRFKGDDGQDFPDWEEHLLGNVATLFNGRAYKQTEWEDTGTPVIRLQNLTGSGDTYYYSNIKLPANQYCNTGDLLYMWSATFGPVWWQGEKAIYHYHIWKIDTDNNNLSKNYLFYVLDDITAKMKRTSNGSTMAHITKGGMEKLALILPSVTEQTKIANFLTAIDDKITNAQTQLKALKQYKQGLLQQMFI